MTFVEPVWSEYKGPPTETAAELHPVSFSAHLGTDVCYPQPCTLYRLRRVGLEGTYEATDPASVLACRVCGVCYQPTLPADIRIP